MATLIPYLTFNGDCEAAFNFYKSVFGGEFAFIGRFKDMPAMGGKEIPAAEGEKIMHVSLPIGGGSVLMGSDSSESCGHKVTVGNNFSISINAGSEAEADTLFVGLSKGGKVTMPLAKAFWGAYFGMFTDKFGINWMVNYDYNRTK
jgi:PhnB protein